MLTCKDASRLISESQERPLGFLERWGLRLHLWMCVSCRRFEQHLALMRQALRKYGRQVEAEANDPDTDGIDLSPEARERIRQAVSERCNHEH